jgi:hypothetical protein
MWRLYHATKDGRLFNYPVHLSSYFTRVLYDTGITLSDGQSMTFNLVISLSHQLHDGFTLADGESHKPLFFGPGETFEFGCTVTAV